MRVTDEPSLLDAIISTPLAMVLSNPRQMDNPLEVVNAAFCDLTGYSENEVLGQNCRFLAGAQPDQIATAKIRAAIKDAQPTFVEIRNFRRDGSMFRNGVMITPILGDDERPRWFLGSQVTLGAGSSPEFADRQRASALRVNALAPRQRQVLELMARGLLNKQIAWELKIAEKTVKMHRAHLLQRLDVTNSAEAIRIAVEAGL